jgi:NAD(P)-dependent dehydrogenase (short-subunit alcohol dehydrogenase family)
MGRLEGKRTLITGASTGIGAATARLFAAEGGAVAVLDVNEDDGSRLVEDLAAGGATAYFISCDVADGAGAERAVAEAARLLGGLDVVFANAGVGTITVGGTIETIPPDRWDLAFDVNVRGVYHVIRAAMPHLRAAGGGSIVITSSASAVIGVSRRETHAYSATKGALLSLARSMAVTYGPEGIRVNALVPGHVRTRLTEDVLGNEEARSAALAGVPLGRYAVPEELARCALFLASEDASFVTGTMLVADGGQTAA